jgi:hypothetical protein
VRLGAGEEHGLAALQALGGEQRHARRKELFVVVDLDDVRRRRGRRKQFLP